MKHKIVDIESLTLDRVIQWADRGETVILTRNGQARVAVTAVDALRRLTEERELLRRLALGELESAAAEGSELEAVLADCRLLLEEN